MLAGHRSLRDGRLARFDLLQGRCLLLTAARGALLCLIWSGLVWQVWWPLYERLPARLHGALAWLPLLAVPLGVGALIDLYGWRTAWKWIGGGLVASVAAARWLA
jgi:hypothetical protein